MRDWVVFVLVLFGVGCSADYPASPSPTPSLAAIQVHYTNPHRWVNPGHSVTLMLYAIDTEGVYELVTDRASWFSTNTAVVSVTNGVARGVSGGVADVMASYQGLSSTARVVVLDPNVRYPWLDIRSFPSPQTGSIARATAVFYQTASSASRDVSDQATWASSDARVFTVEAGRVTAHGPGTAAITATFSGVSATSYASVPPIRALP